MSWLARLGRALLLLPPKPEPPDPYAHPKIRELKRHRLLAARKAQHIELRRRQNFMEREMTRRKGKHA